MALVVVVSLYSNLKSDGLADTADKNNYLLRTTLTN